MKSTTLRTISGIPKADPVTQLFEGFSFTMPAMFGDSQIKFEIVRGMAISLAEEQETTIRTSSYEKCSTGMYTTFRHKDVNYYMILSETHEVLVFTRKTFELACKLRGINVQYVDLPDSTLVSRVSPSHYNIAAVAFNIFQAMTDVDDDEACRIIYHKLSEAHDDSGKFIIRILQTEEFRKAVGAKQWIRKCDRTWNRESPVELVNLGDKPLKSFPFYGNQQMFCIAQDGNLCLFSTCSSISARWLDSTHMFAEFDLQDFLLTGAHGTKFPIMQNVTMKDAILWQGLELSENPVITVEGDNTVKIDSFSSCIKANGVITIKGEGTLNLKCSAYSSVIGAGAESQSCGRYAPSFRPTTISKIVFDGCTVNVECDTENFSIGNYGEDNDIEIELRNGAKVTGMPEMDNKVRLVSVGMTSGGSTKFEGPAVYCVEKREAIGDKHAPKLNMF